MGRFFHVESKPFKFFLEQGGNSFVLCIVELGKVYLWSIFLGRDGVFWLLSTVGAVARLENNVGFMQKLRVGHNAVLGQCCCNTCIWPLKSSTVGDLLGWVGLVLGLVLGCLMGGFYCIWGVMWALGVVGLCRFSRVLFVG